MITINEDNTNHIDYVYRSLGSAKKHFSFFKLHHFGTGISTSKNKLDLLDRNQENNGDKSSIIAFEGHQSTVIFFFELVITEDYATSKKIAERAFSILNKVNKSFYDILKFEFNESTHDAHYWVKGRAIIKDIPTLDRFIKMGSELTNHIMSNSKMQPKSRRKRM